MQRILRSSSLPADISLHRQATRAEIGSPQQSDRSILFDLVHFKTTVVSGNSNTILVKSEARCREGRGSSKLFKPALLPFLSPIDSSGSATGVGKSSSSLLFSFVLPPIDGVVLYGASLIQYREEQCGNENDTVHQGLGAGEELVGLC